MRGRIDFNLDDTSKLLRLALVGEVHDDQALKEIEAYWQSHPQIVGYDSTVDLRQDEGAVSWHGMTRIAERWNAFARNGEGGGRTALIVRDAAQSKMAELVAVKFPARLFAVFRSPDEAHRWLKG